MDSQKSCKNNESNKHVLISLLLIILGVFSFFLVIKSDDLVFAGQPLIPIDEKIREVLFLPDPLQEKASYGPKLITIQRGDTVFNTLTTLSNVYDILRENNIELNKNDYVYLNTEYVINGSIIKIVRTSNTIFEMLEEIPFEKEIIENPQLLKGEEKVIQEGKNGIKKLVYFNTYEDNVLVKSELIDEIIIKKPIKEIKKIGTSMYSLDNIEKKRYNCPFWYSVVDSGPYTQEEKDWLKFMMYCESGCNAESNKSNYKGLFQWSPYWWNKQFDENIFDGYAQIKHTVEKYRAGEATRSNQWPRCNAKYLKATGGN
jgi:hypothetical protein